MEKDENKIMMANVRTDVWLTLHPAPEIARSGTGTVFDKWSWSTAATDSSDVLEEFQADEEDSTPEAPPWRVQTSYCLAATVNQWLCQSGQDLKYSDI